MSRTWNLKLMATADRPETTLTGITQDAVAAILRPLMHGEPLPEHALAAEARERTLMARERTSRTREHATPARKRVAA